MYVVIKLTKLLIHSPYCNNIINYESKIYRRMMFNYERTQGETFLSRAAHNQKTLLINEIFCLRCHTHTSRSIFAVGVTICKPLGYDFEFQGIIFVVFTNRK